MRDPRVAPKSKPTRRNSRNGMPLIQVRLIKEQTSQIISKLSDAMGSIEGEEIPGVS